MPTEIWVALITGAVSVIGFLLTFSISNKKLKAEQEQRMMERDEKLHEEIVAFQHEARESASELQDAFAEHKVEMQQALSELKSSYRQTEATIALRLAAIEKKQEMHNNVIERVYGLEARMKVVENNEEVRGK